MECTVTLSRRAVLRGGSLLLGSGWLHGMADGTPAVRFGMVTDVHHADKPEWGTRYYRESLAKLREAVAQIRGSHPAFLIQLGDLVDAAKDLDTERHWLKQAIGTLSESGVQLLPCLATTGSTSLSLVEIFCQTRSLARAGEQNARVDDDS